MIILERIKDANGEIVSYRVKDMNSKVESIVPAESLSAFPECIDNAILTDKGYVAKKGCHIKTKIKANSEPFENIDYYGKDFLTVCRKIRKYANVDMFEVDIKDKDICLLKLLQACNINIRKFLQTVLSYLQPYSLTYSDRVLIGEIGYGVRLLIRFNESDTMTVSLQESKHKKYFSDKLCAVFANRCEPYGGFYNVDYIVASGTLVLVVNSRARYYRKGTALVEFKDIKKKLDANIGAILKDIQSNYLSKLKDKTFDTITNEQLSFMATGYATVNNICLLIDLFAQYTDSRSRLAISTIALNLLDETTKENREEIIEALKLKYDGTGNKLYLALKE